MIEVTCRTNLDLFNEKWPRELPAVPRVGDHIASATKHRDGFRLTLQVVQVTYEPTRVRGFDEWEVVVELHMTRTQRELPCSKGEQSRGSILAFYEWYAPKVGTTVSSFI